MGGNNACFTLGRVEIMPVLHWEEWAYCCGPSEVVKGSSASGTSSSRQLQWSSREVMSDWTKVFVAASANLLLTQSTRRLHSSSRRASYSSGSADISHSGVAGRYIA